MAVRRYQGIYLGPIGFLIIFNLLFYVAVSIRPSLLSVLGFMPASFLQEPWTILTSIFVHSPFPSFWHIVANMITLYFFGSYLLRLVGDKRFFIVYFIGGILGNVCYLFLGSPFSTVIGASGAVFALGGALAVMRPKLKVFIIPIPVPIPLWVAVIGGFLVVSFFPYVAWQAHLGGLVFGLIMGFFFRRRLRRFIW